MKKLIFFIAAIIGFLSWLKWGNVASGIRAVESALNPVFHKKTINRYAGIYKEDPLFVTALIKVESNFFKSARSARGAVGLMQVMPATAKEAAEEIPIRNFKPDQLKDPETNIRIGTHYLAKLRKEFGNHHSTVLAAYNAGGKNVKEWMKDKRKRAIELDEIQFPETQKFVEDVLHTYAILKKFQAWRGKIIKQEERSNP